MRRLVAIVVLFGAAAFGTVAYAWSEAGHKIIASIAFRQLTPDEQAKIVAILKTHPRLRHKFLLREEIHFAAGAEGGPDQPRTSG